MGNSWGNCPSNINDQVERCGFFFSPPVSMVTAALRDFPQEMNQREKKRIGREKGQRRVRKRREGGRGVQYFLLRGRSLVSFGTNRVLIHRSQGVSTNLSTVCVIVFALPQHSFLLCSQLAKWDSYARWHMWRQGGFLPQWAFQLPSSSLCDKLRPRT